MPKVTTTIRPDREMEVSEGEVRNLRRLGILATVDGKAVGEKSTKTSETSDKKTAANAPADEKKG